MDPRFSKAMELGKRMAARLEATRRQFGLRRTPDEEDEKLLAEWELFRMAEAPAITTGDARLRMEYGPPLGSGEVPPEIVASFERMNREAFETRCARLLVSEVMAPELRILLTEAVRLSSQAQLIERAVRAARPNRTTEAPRWVAVMDTFALGSTSATNLCRAFGLDPHERVQGARCTCPDETES